MLHSASYSRRTHIAARLARKVYRWRFRLLQADRYNRHDRARVHGLSLVVLPGVFHPEFFFATDFFLTCLDRYLLAGRQQALDVGCGSGALAVALGRRGATVTAVDINPQAVRCTQANIVAHGLEERITVLEGDLFAPVAGRYYDLIVFNPPFYARRARDIADRAWAGGHDNQTLFRFLAEAPKHLGPGGEMLVMGSTEAPYTVMLAHAAGYNVRLIGRRELISECLFLFALRPT